MGKFHILDAAPHHYTVVYPNLLTELSWSCDTFFYQARRLQKSSSLMLVCQLGISEGQFKCTTSPHLTKSQKEDPKDP
jgi:hypothetical protein